ncbi:LPXTG cell wall anchor domain-containing protein [Micromonospora sp. CPCC 205371]|nr:LPXTG cell wall anchor domain-containing protein [Micromonospora sp. CPCC 205371]
MPAIVFQWFPKDWIDDNGGIEEFAKKDSGQGTTPVAGTGGTLSLAAKELPIPAETNRLGFAYVKLVTPPATPTPSPSASVPATPDTTPPASGSGGGLPVTGADAATLGIAGGGLLIAGAVAFLVARRRRARFTT